MDRYFKQGSVLVLAPHTDDAELGCGGTLARLVEEGHDVYAATFSLCEKSLPVGYTTEDFRNEFIAAMNVLGIPTSNLTVYDYEVREFSAYRQEILDNLINLRDRIKPSLVLMPSLSDVHQDHLTIAKEGIRAFKRCTILCYEAPWNNLTFNNQAFVALTESQLNKKIAAIAEDVSQAGRDYTQPEYIRSLAKARGVQVGIDYAEAFEVPRLVI